MATEPDPDDEAELRALAEELGLERLLASDRDGFVAALKAARGYVKRGNPPPSIYDEPAHVCRFGARED